MKIAVTGGCGFVGSHIVETLIENGHRPHIIDRADLPGWLFKLGVDYTQIDIALDGCPSLADHHSVIHAAAYADISRNWDSHEERFALYRDNIAATTQTLESALAAQCRVVFISSAAVHWGAGESPYAATKAFGENITKAYCSGVMPYSIVRLVSCVGRRYSHGHIKDFVDQAKIRGHIVGKDDGLQPKSFVHVKDAAEAIAALAWAEHPCPHKTVAAGTWSWRDTAAMMGVPSFPSAEVAGWRGDPVGLRVASDVRPRFTVGEGVREALVSLGWFK